MVDLYNTEQRTARKQRDELFYPAKLNNMKIKLHNDFALLIGKKIATILLFGLSCTATAFAKDNHHAAIATAHPLATAAGFEILQQGGNAFDAAVAISAALAVVEPASSGLGGGGFWLLHRASDGFETMLDGREKAPLAATKDMYLNEQGEVVKGLSKEGALAAAIPGMPAAIVHLAEKYGSLPLKTLLQPAIRYAEQGFEIGERHRRLLSFRVKVLQQTPEANRILLENGKIPVANFILKQADLAQTLKAIAKQGKAGFYQGEVANKLLKSVQQQGGIWTQADLNRYQVIERMPVYGLYKGIKITSAALPSSGGIVLTEALNILSGYDLNVLDEVKRKHLISEAMRRAYHDRALYLGDADFIEIPVTRLLNRDYAAGLRSSIRLDKTLPSSELTGEEQAQEKGADTTHFSIIDVKGNRVSATLSINYPFGAGVITSGTGVILNNEMDDFASKAGAMNGYGLVGGVANAIEPEKRMLSSMTPTFLEDNNCIAVLGTPGGSRIISMLLLATLDFAQGKSPQSWVSVPRFHHQYIPDEILYEPQGLTEQEQQGLSALGHRLKQKSYRYGNMQAVEMNKNTGEFKAASDPRGEGLAEVREIIFEKNLHH